MIYFFDRFQYINARIDLFDLQLVILSAVISGFPVYIA